MKTLHGITGIAALAVFLVAADASAQAAAPRDTDRQRIAEAGMIDTNWLIDAPVRAPDGRDLGTISRVWMDPKTGQVQNIVVKAGGVDGRPVERRAIAWDDVQVAWTAQQLIVTMDADAFAKAREASEAELRESPAASPAAPSSR